MRILPVVLLCLTVGCIKSAVAQEQKKIAVKFQCTCDDPVGSRYETAVRDLIATSPRYKAATEFIENPGPNSVPNFGIRVVSLDPHRGDNLEGAETIYSVVITWGAFYYTSAIRICGSNNVQTAAQDTIALLDKYASL